MERSRAGFPTSDLLTSGLRPLASDLCIDLLGFDAQGVEGLLDGLLAGGIELDLVGVEVHVPLLLVTSLLNGPRTAKAPVAL